MRRDLLVPSSIVVGSAIIATGLYVGLRGEGAGPDAIESSAPARPHPEAPADAAPAARLAPSHASSVTAQPPPAGDAALRDRVAAEATAALEADRPRLRSTCWDPAVSRAPEPARARYVFDVTFDADGTEIARGISESRDAARSDVARCLREQPLTLRVPPPGTNVGVQLTLDLPGAAGVGAPAGAPR